MPDDESRDIKNSTPSAATPTAAEHFFKRPAVDRTLREAFNKPLTTVIAGAGYGKTQAVLSALQGLDRGAAWILLSVLDNLADRFWERLTGAAEPWSRSLGVNLASLGFPKSIAAFDQFLKLLANELKDKRPFVLVFDDFHLIYNKTILNFVELFISARVQNISIVLISRKKPDVSMSGMLSKGLLARVTEDDLRFSKDEIGAYLLTRGLELGESVIDEINSYTGGWIFAVYLVGLAAKKGETRNPFAPAKLDVFDLIEKEIFADVSAELQNFLIRISILDEIPADLLKRLADGDVSLISEALAISMFIRFDATSDSYRIHHLFREFLREKSRRLSESDITKTRLTAAEWYAGDDQKFDAIYHYERIGRYDEIFDLIISIPGRVLSEVADAIIKLIERAPKEMIKARPVIRVVKAGYMFNNNRLDEVRVELNLLREEFEPRPRTDANDAVLGEVYALLAVLCMVESDYEFERYFKEADALLPNGSILIDHRTGMADGVSACSIRDPSAGELKRNQDALFRAVPHMTRVMNGCGCGLDYLNAAESGLYVGDLKAAEKYAYEAIYKSKRYEQFDVEYMANFVLVRIFTAKGNYQKIIELLIDMERQLGARRHADCITLYAIIGGWFNTKIGRTDLVAGWIKREEETRRMLAPVVVGREYLVRSDCMMAEGKYYELLAFMEQTDGLYRARGILFALTQNLITKAIVHYSIGNHAESIRFLNEAYELTNPNDLIMQYVEYGNKMRTLIYAARSDKDCAIPKAWLDRIYTKSSSYAKMLSQLVSAYEDAHATDVRGPIDLSKRELDVLEHLYRGMTRKEMASNLYISVSTVNSVIKNIYNKLDAANVVEAVRIAREKGLINSLRRKI